jgi:hypothetical protein
LKTGHNRQTLRDQGSLGVTVSPDREEEREPSTQEAQSEHRESRSLLAIRLLAAAALLVTGLIHARLAFQLGTDGTVLGPGRLFFAQAVLSVILAFALLTRDSRVWLFAVVLSGAGLAGILVSIYFPLPSMGPFPAINDPTWLQTKAVSALADVTVIALWLIRQIAPPSPPE